MDGIIIDQQARWTNSHAEDLYRSIGEMRDRRIGKIIARLSTGAALGPDEMRVIREEVERETAPLTQTMIALRLRFTDR